MKIKIDDIFEFSKLRIECHVRTLNYFAEMFGLHFPEHDNDKNIEPLRTGYSYIIYAEYHQNFHLLPAQEKLCLDAKDTHHKHSLHHMLYYKNAADIPDIRIYEMVCDWASANFERKNVLCQENTPGLDDWFEQNKSKLDWTPHQLDLIQNALKTIHEKTDKDAVRSIWTPVLKYVNL